MAYAQNQYNEILGHPGNETIAEAGCLLTSFSNLEQSFGNSIDPVALNNFFIAHNDYLQDGNVKDNLAWHSVSQFDPNTVMTSSVDHGTNQTAGWPSTDKAIVRFHYRSIAYPTLPNGEPNYIFHFCKVADAANQLILDSWDGKIKKSPYGEPTAFATYERYTPVSSHANPTPSVASPNQPPAPEPSKPETYEVVKAILGYGDANNAANHIDPVDTVSPGTYSIFNQADGMINVTEHAGTAGSWINPKDNVPYSSANIKGAAQTSKPLYTLKTTVMGFSTANDAVNHKNAKVTISAGSYSIFNTRYGMLNLTKDPKNPGAWINPKDEEVESTNNWNNPRQNTVAPAKADPINVNIPATDTRPTQWKSTYKPLRDDYKGVKFTMLEDYGAHDLNDYDPVSNTYAGEVYYLPKDLSIAFYGTFTGPDGNKYWRPKLKNDSSFTKYVGVPLSDKVNGIPTILIEEQQQPLDLQDLTTYKSGNAEVSTYGYAVALAERIDQGFDKAVKVIDGFVGRRK